MRYVVSSGLGGLLAVVLLGGCSSDAKEEKPPATVPAFSAPKAAPITPAKAPADKAAAQKVGFQ